MPESRCSSGKGDGGNVAVGAVLPPANIAAAPRSHHTECMHSSVTLTLNGEGRVFDGPADGPLSLSALLVVLGLDTKKVAVERNEEIVPRSRYAETWLASGDSLEIVHFIGGG
jgi:sulfur carrier protein